jgi:hypothetical protein
MATDITIGLGEAFASYQPSTIAPADWARLRPEFEARYLELGFGARDWSVLRPRLSCVAAYVGLMLETREGATLAQLVTTRHVDSYLQRLRDGGANGGTLQNRQSALNMLLRGGRVPLSRPGEGSQDSLVSHRPAMLEP